MMFAAHQDLKTTKSPTSLCSPAFPGAHYVGQVEDLPASASQAMEVFFFLVTRNITFYFPRFRTKNLGLLET